MNEEEIVALERRFEDLMIDLGKATDRHDLLVILNDFEFMKGAAVVFGDLREKNGLPWEIKDDPF